MGEKEKRSRQVAIIAGIFTALAGLLLVLNYLQIQASDPLNSLALKTIVERLSAESDNQQLMGEVRQLDLLARKAYFTSMWQIKTGGYLMLFGAIIMVLALRVYYKQRFSIEKPSEDHLSEKKSRQRSQLWIGISGVSILLLAGLSAIFSINHLKQFDAAKASVTSEDTNDNIEKIEITSLDSTSVKVDSITADTANLESGDIIPLNETTVKQQHNGFRGAWGSAVSTRSNIPVAWNGASGENILWKTGITMSGNNSPVIWGDKIFLSGANNSKRVVYCIDRLTGKKLWEKEANAIAGSPSAQPKTTDDTGLAAPSLTVDGQRVFAIFGNGDIIALELNGNRVWARNLGVPSNHYGHSSSLLTWDGKVFVQYDMQKGSKVLALSAETGKTVWETARSNEISWSSPIFVKVKGKIQLVLLANPNLSGYDINNGKQLWSVDCMTGEVGPSPVFGGGLIYAANEYARMVAVNPATAEIVWENNDRLPEVSSPAYNEGLVFVGTTFAVLACFDAGNGEMLWEYEANTGFYSSPMIAAGKLYIFDTDGKAYIFSPGRKAQLIGSPELGEKVYSTPVFADGRIYIRGVKNLYCIGKK